MSTDNTSHHQPETLTQDAAKRRDLLKKAGKIGLYAAPAMMLLVSTKKAAALSLISS
jgi:hypothetical protein